MSMGINRTMGSAKSVCQNCSASRRDYKRTVRILVVLMAGDEVGFAIDDRCNHHDWTATY